MKRFCNKCADVLLAVMAVLAGYGIVWFAVEMMRAYHDGR